MSDEETASTPSANADKLWIATLKFGNIYVYAGEAPFYKDVPSKPISNTIKEALEEDAVEVVNVTMGQDVTAETRQKFVFEEAPAKRTRAKA